MIDKIKQILTKNPGGLKAREIAKALSENKSSVNSILYHNSEVFAVSNYIWTLKEREEDKEILISFDEDVAKERLKSTKFRYYNCNPHHKRTDDCVIRAIAAATGDSWEETLRELTEYMLKTGYMISTPELYGKYLKDKGWKKQKQPVHKDGTKVLIKEFLDTFDGSAVAHAGKGHVTYLSEGNLYDIWNCENEVLGSYWTYEEND